MRPPTILAGLLVAMATASSAQVLQATPDAANAVGAAELAAMDADRSGTLERAELEAYAHALVERMDADASGDLTREEMAAWRAGVRDFAVFRGRTQAYGTMASVLFDFADRDADGRVTVAEQVAATVRIAAQADADDDGVTTTSEFDRHSIVAVGLRLALGSPPG